MADVEGLLLGLGIFLVPAAIFGWSALTRRGRRKYEEHVDEMSRFPLAAGIPLRPPRTRYGQWAANHPWRGALAAAVIASPGFFLLHWLVFDLGLEDALLRSAGTILELTLVMRVFAYGPIHKHFGTRKTGA